MFDRLLLEQTKQLVAAMTAAGLKLATVESCTGGLVAALITEIPGASSVLERGFITYSNAAKVGLVGIDLGLIRTYGAVSAEVARAMAEGGVRASAADVAVAVTGIAGPGGGTADKPVGLVHVAVAGLGRAALHRECRFGEIGRSAVRLAAVAAAIELLVEFVDI